MGGLSYLIILSILIGIVLVVEIILVSVKTTRKIGIRILQILGWLITVMGLGLSILMFADPMIGGATRDNMSIVLPIIIIGIVVVIVSRLILKRINKN
jgi:D-alanyl-lipoteichoic acid acyltransferase DltB (MBOAT superfamily)